MEIAISREQSLRKSLKVSGIVIIAAFALVVIAYGIDYIIPGVHDGYHDFRHVIGMPCH